MAFMINCIGWHYIILNLYYGWRTAEQRFFAGSSSTLVLSSIEQMFTEILLHASSMLEMADR